MTIARNKTAQQKKKKKKRKKELRSYSSQVAVAVADKQPNETRKMAINMWHKNATRETIRLNKVNG